MIPTEHFDISDREGRVEKDVIYLVTTSPTSHYYMVWTDNVPNATWLTYYSLKRAREAHPTLTKTVSITQQMFNLLLPPVVVAEEDAGASDEEQEAYYLVHNVCGESFDSMKTALEHMKANANGFCKNHNDFDLLPEAEAM